MKRKLKLSSIARYLFILSTLMELGSAALTQKPTTAEALTGDRTVFNCSTSLNSSEIQWFHYPIQQNPQRTHVYAFGKLSPEYKSRVQIERNNITGAYNLIIPSVNLVDAGKYECQDDNARGEKASADLVVIKSLPVCASATDLTKVIGKNNCGIKSDQLLLSCVVQYKGNEPPVMKWRKLGEQTTIDSQIAPTKQSDKIIYNITMDGASVDNGSAFECFASRAAAPTRCHTNNVTVISKAGDVWFHVLLSALLAAAVVLWLVSCGFCLKLSIERRRERNSKRSDSEMHELKPLAKNKLLEDDPKNLKAENERIMKKLTELEAKLYMKGKIDYLPVPKLVHITPTEKAKTAIRGIAILSGELFAVFENTPYIEVLDSVTFFSKPSFTGVESTDAKDLLWNPQDIAASKVNGCLYVIHQTRDDKKAEIWKIDAVNRRKVHHWPLECRIGRLSTHEYSVIVCAVEEKKILEYSLEGKLLRIVSLCPVDGFDHLWHTIKVTGEHYLVSNEDKNKRHRICLVDTSESIVIRAEQSKKLILDTPICLTEDKDRSILVLNAKSAKNTSVTVLSTDLVYSRKTLKLSAEGNSVRICLDDSGSMLFVAVNDGDPSTDIWHSGRIAVYSIL